MKRTSLAFACLASVGVTAWQASRAAVQQAFLVQNSGWMEPFYSDPASEFKALVAAVVDAAADPEDPIFVSAFNQSVPGAPSPRVVYQGHAGPGAHASVNMIEVATKPGSRSLADTDFQEAIQQTIVTEFGARSGIVWIFTNNKNSPNNDPDTARRNRDFYEVLHNEPAIVRTLAIPLGMPVQGHSYRAQGLMIYALAYGSPAAAQLQQIVSKKKFRGLFTTPAARLKPLDEDGARLVPREVRNAPGVHVSLGPDHRTLVLDVDYHALRPSVDIVASVENMLFPYEIRGADLAAQVQGEGWHSSLGVSPSHLAGLKPDATQEATVSLPLPTAAMPSPWSFRSLSMLGKSFIMPANIEVTLSNQDLVLGTEFVDRLATIFPGDPLSEVFLPPQQIRSSRTRIPLLVRISYPVYPLVVLIFGVLLLLGGVLAFASLATGIRRYEIVVDEESRKMSVKGFREYPIHSPTGVVIGAVKRTFGRPVVVRVAEGHTITIRN
jgi:hypothetical protein